jgi:hypothetical protein
MKKNQIVLLVWLRISVQGAEVGKRHFNKGLRRCDWLDSLIGLSDCY